MSPRSALHGLVLERFRATFGEPSTTNGKAQHWSLRALRHVTAVNILMDSEPEYPVVWVFDPHDPTNGVSNTTITEEAQIDRLVASITAAVKGASLPPSRR